MNDTGFPGASLDGARSGAASSAPLPPVRATASLHAFAELGFTFLRASIRDELSELHEIELDLLLREASVDLADLLGTRVTLELERGALRRVFPGIVAVVEDLGARVDGEDGTLETIVRLQVAPELWLLSRRVTSRIFHHTTALEIVRTVLRGAGVYQKGNLDIRVADLEGSSIRPREYCVQYQESDLDFVRRLLEEEGLTFYFAQSGDAELESLVVVDSGLARDEVYRRVDNGSSRDRIEIVDSAERHALHPEQTFLVLGAALEVRPATFVVHDHDFSNTRSRDATVSRHGTAAQHAGRGYGPLAVYEHPGRYVFDPLDRVVPSLPLTHTAYPEAPRSEHHTGKRLAKVRSEELGRDHQTFRARSNVIDLEAGALFTLRQHVVSDYDREYLVVSVTHEIRAREAARGEAGDGALGGDAHYDSYHNELRALAADTVFRPARKTPKPRIHGAQTALVVGHVEQEILTDWYGRIKIQLHWDRESGAHRNAELGALSLDPASNPEHLCWARVAQTWAGAGWGAMFVPRVGMEVVVVFLDGDPDRPLVVGCVYNDANPPPYALPQDVSRSTIRTRSTPVTPGDDRYNELRFDDTAHREELYLRAQRDLNEHVGRNQVTEIGERHEQRVGTDELLTVVGNQRAGVGGTQELSVGGGQVLEVGGDQRTHVSHAQTETIGGDAERTCMQNETITVMGTRTTRIYGADVLESVGPTSVSVRPTHPVHGDPDAPSTEAEYLDSRIVMGSRYRQVDGVDEYWADTTVSVIEENEKRTIGKGYTVNAGEDLNLLVTGIDDPEGSVAGVFVDKAAIRIGSHAKSVEEVVLFRGANAFHIGEEQVTVQADGKPLELRIGDSGCVIRLSSDGKKVELTGLEEIVLKGGSSTLTIGDGITLDAKGGEVNLLGSKVNA